MSDFTDLRALLDPQTHKAQLEAAKTELKRKLSSWFIELDTVEDNPEVPADAKKATTEQFEGLIRDAGWRIGRIDDMLQQIDDAAKAAVAAPSKPTPLADFKATPTPSSD